VIEVRADAGTAVEAALALHSPFGREFRYVARAVAGTDGVARLRVPYASDAKTPVAAREPWELRVGDARLPVMISEEDVLQGATVPVALPAVPHG
jgi:hypothetical protein